jgi:7-cyano-7-deazaguanine synthase
MTKAGIVKLAVELKAPIEFTWSCYEGGDRPCGKCDSCILRARGFEDAGYSDPAFINKQ